MNCPICGAVSSELLRKYDMDHHRVDIDRVCNNGHKYQTVEVYPTQLADAREMACAVRTVNRRVERYARDLKITLDSRPTSEVAAEYGLTDARVRQIRAYISLSLSSKVRAKIASK